MSSFNNKAEATLIFIPDISGYTQFVSNTEILHAKHIMEELLEVIIDANEIGLELSEIEGDALLYYRKGTPPTVDEMMGQVKKMFTKFHEHIKKYETQRICSCGACRSANKLTLKFVAHYGEVAEKEVKDRKVLFGKEVIVAHRLLKNKINSDEYGMFSHELLNACDTWKKLPDVSWSEVTHMEEDYDFGKANYCFVDLEPLLKQVPEPQAEDYSLPGATKLLFESEQLVEAPLDLAFNVLSDYSFRHEFTDGISASDLVNHKVTQNGSTHRCVINENESDPFFIAHNYSFSKNKITFAETLQKEKVTNVYTLTALGKNLTKLEIRAFSKPNLIKTLIFNLFFKKKIQNINKKTFANFNQYCKKLVAADQSHPNEILLPEGVISFNSTN